MIYMGSIMGHHGHHVPSSSRTYSPPTSRTKRVVFLGGGLRQIDSRGMQRDPTCWLLLYVAFQGGDFGGVPRVGSKSFHPDFLKDFTDCKLQFQFCSCYTCHGLSSGVAYIMQQCFTSEPGAQKQKTSKRPQVHRAVSDPQHDSLTAVPFEET